MTPLLLLLLLACSRAAALSVMPGYNISIGGSLKAVRYMGTDIIASFQSPSSHSLKDWVGLYECGSCLNNSKQDCAVIVEEVGHEGQSTGELIYRWDRDSESRCLFGKLKKGGYYELRYWAEDVDAFEVTFKLAARSTPFKIKDIKKYFLQIMSPNTAFSALGSDVVVQWQVPRNHSHKDWIGMFPKGQCVDTNDCQVAMKWVENFRRSEGQVVFGWSSGRKAERLKERVNTTWPYEVRYFVEGSAQPMAKAGEIMFTEPLPMQTLKLRNYRFGRVQASSQGVVVDYATGSVVDSDYIGMFLAGDCTDLKGDCKYQDLQPVPKAGSGSVAFKVPAWTNFSELNPLNAFELRYFVGAVEDATSNVSISVLATSNPFVILGACKEDCTGHGECFNTTCMCDFGYMGSSCYQPDPTEAIGAGQSSFTPDVIDNPQPFDNSWDRKLRDNTLFHRRRPKEGSPSDGLRDFPSANDWRMPTAYDFIRPSPAPTSGSSSSGSGIIYSPVPQPVAKKPTTPDCNCSDPGVVEKCDKQKAAYEKGYRDANSGVVKEMGLRTLKKVDPCARTPLLESEPDWDYDGQQKGARGPGNWYQLNMKYKSCKATSQSKQSPVDIVIDDVVEDNTLGKLELNLRTHDMQLISANHGIRLLPLTPGDPFAACKNDTTPDTLDATVSSVAFQGVKYYLHHIQVYRPSEHVIDHMPMEMELQLMMKDLKGNSLLLSVLGNQIVGDEDEVENKQVGKLVSHLEQMPATLILETDKLMPKEKAYLTYNGSLSTPPCTEAVTHVVMQSPIDVSREQVMAIKKHLASLGNFNGNNARPLQPLNNRTIRALPVANANKVVNATAAVGTNKPKSLLVQSNLVAAALKGSSELQLGSISGLNAKTDLILNPFGTTEELVTLTSLDPLELSKPLAFPHQAGELLWQLPAKGSKAPLPPRYLDSNH